MTDPDPVSADYTLRPSELAATLALHRHVGVGMLDDRHFALAGDLHFVEGGAPGRFLSHGRHGVISPDQARRKAAQMIVRIKAGEDPNPEATKKPSGPTVAELAERYLVEHVQVRCKPRTVEAGRWLVKKFVLPDLGDMAIDEVEREHISDLHHKHRNTPYQANRILEVVRKMFNLAEGWGCAKTAATRAAMSRSTRRRSESGFFRTMSSTNSVKY